MNVLLYCNNYDAFMLEEDGQIEEKLFEEYASQNLRYPPFIIQTDKEENLFNLLAKEKIDLVILMLNTSELDIFHIAEKIKSRHPEKPLVLLTHFNRDSIIKYKAIKSSGIDYIFSWLGNTNLILSIIKLLEDKMNVEADIQKAGVQVILLVEDSVRFYSAYLPLIYEFMLKQSSTFKQEGLNKHQQNILMRGRPKVLLARDYETAQHYLDKYEQNLLGVISDVSFYRNGKKDAYAGKKLLKYIREKNTKLPVLVQSFSEKHISWAEEANAAFLHKASENLGQKLRSFFYNQLAFGYFIFRQEEGGNELGRAKNLAEFALHLQKVPDSCLHFHAKREDFSHWLKARSLFQLAELFSPLMPEHFTSTDAFRSFLVNAISLYRFSKAKGTIADFDPELFGNIVRFARMGRGSLGGKARALAFFDMVLKQEQLSAKYSNIIISVPKTAVITSQYYDEFIEQNNLFYLCNEPADDSKILELFLQAQIPAKLLSQIDEFAKLVETPVAVRSSSVLEDSYRKSFAGVYDTFMISPNPDSSIFSGQIARAVKAVYASVFYKSSRAYIQATSNMIDEEKMSVILQEVTGHKQEYYFYPDISGVARSVNYYPIAPEKTNEGIANIAMGLGCYIVSGMGSLRFAPKYPKKCLQLSSPEIAMKDTQKKIFALNLEADNFIDENGDQTNISELKLRTIKSKNLKQLVSVMDYENNIIRDGLTAKGMKLLTFAPILKHSAFPLAEIVKEILELGERQLQCPIEIEFAVKLASDKKSVAEFSLLQLRPFSMQSDRQTVNLADFKQKKALILSENVMGNGIKTHVNTIIYIKQNKYLGEANRRIAANIEVLNKKMKDEARQYILIGPGRWGSSDDNLGVPVRWDQISEAELIVEANFKGFSVDPSNGTHFFHNLINFGISYFTLNQDKENGMYDLDFLNRQNAEYEDEYIRLITFEETINIAVDGNEGKGGVFIG